MTHVEMEAFHHGPLKSMSNQEAGIIRVIDSLEKIVHRLFLVGLASEALEDDAIKQAFAGAIDDLEGFVRNALEALRDLLDSSEVETRDTVEVT